MRAPRLAAAAIALTCVTGAFVAGVARTSTHAPPPHRADEAAMRSGRMRQFWPDGTLKSDVGYRRDAYDGAYRTFYPSGAPYELRHYVNGHEAGLQQSWSEDGTLYLNYEVHDGRRFGLVNATPCHAVGLAAGSGVTTTEASTRRITNAPVLLSTESRVPGALPFYGDASFAAHWAPVAHRVAPFTLVTQTGGVISGATLAGRPYVASFVYTQCAGVCPILVSQLARVHAAARGTRIVSFSVTPETDTPATLAAFGGERGIDPRDWSLVTGDKKTIYTLARTSYFADDSRVGAAADDETAFLHSEKLLLVDAVGRLRGVYNGTQPHAVDQLITDLAALALSQSGRSF